MLSALLVYGVAPRPAMKVITWAWPRSDPRRGELRAELEAVPYWKRPLFVADVLGAALSDGLPLRARRFIGRVARWRASLPLAREAVSCWMVRQLPQVRVFTATTAHHGRFSVLVYNAFVAVEDVQKAVAALALVDDPSQVHVFIPVQMLDGLPREARPTRRNPLRIYGD
jgi:hypothetical protein